MDFDRWDEKVAKQMFARLDQMRVHAPGDTLFDQLEFCNHVEAVFEKINVTDSCRELLLEAWLLIDYIVTYLLRDGLHIPERIDDELKLIPFSFDRKLTLIKKLKDIEKTRLPNQKSYSAFELHAEFHSKLMEDKDLYETFLNLACKFEEGRCPKEAVALMRPDFKQSRFVPEWWYIRITALNPEWFQSCTRLNTARNIAAHRLKMTDQEAFDELGVSGLVDFKSVLRGMIESLVFRDRT
jgi:hypothetical protein